MKTKRMISALISACFLSFSFCRIPFTLTAKAETETVQYEKLTYEIADGHAVLTAYTEGIESAVIPDSIEGCPVTAVADLAFANCPTLKSIVLPDSLTDLGNRAFLNCTALESVTLPEGLTAIRHNTFNRCTALERIVIPDSVRVLGTGAFRNCTKLADITFPERLDSVDFRVLTDSAWLDNQPDGFVCFSNVLYGYQGTMPENTVVSPDENITVIAAGALMNQGGLTAVTLREPVSSIGEDAFSACGNLKSVSIPGTVKVIGDYAFAQCRSLEEVTLDSGIGQIGMRAFYDCDALNRITIPASVTEIGDMAVGFRQSPTSPEDDILVVKVSEDFTVFGYAGSTAEGYARTNGIRFSALGAGLIRGDADGDGSLRISDAVLLQKWLLGYADVQLQNWKAADLNDDGTLNAVDLSLMKRALMEQPAHQELQIVLNGSSAKRLSDSFRLQMQELIKARVPDFDFTQYEFDYYGAIPIYDKHDATVTIGNQHEFLPSYQGIPLDRDRYAINVLAYDDGRYELSANYLKPDFQEKMSALSTEELIPVQEAVETAKAYAAGLPYPDPGTGTYQPSESFGENPVLLVYSVEDACLAYKISDPKASFCKIGEGVSSVLISFSANVFVDAKTGEVAGYSYNKSVSIA